MGLFSTKRANTLPSMVASSRESVTKACSVTNGEWEDHLNRAGAYTSALLTTPLSPYHLGGFNLPIPVGMLGAMLTSGLLAYVVGHPTLRLREDYLAIATISIAETLRLLLKNEAWLTNGVQGLRD